MSMIDLITQRRSRYALTNTLPVAQEQLQQIVEQALLQAPSAFNIQSARVVVLLTEKHKQLWDLVLDVLRTQVPAEQLPKTAEKIQSFRAAYGTILYFEDTRVIENIQAQFPLYKDNFPIWAQQANGMLQFSIWTAFAEVGIGANLQHYNPLIDQAVAKAFDIPSEWQLVAQMPFGTPVAPAADKTYVPLSQRLRIEK